MGCTASVILFEGLWRVLHRNCGYVCKPELEAEEPEEDEDTLSCRESLAITPPAAASSVLCVYVCVCAFCNFNCPNLCFRPHKCGYSKYFYVIPHELCTELWAFLWQYYSALSEVAVCWAERFFKCGCVWKCACGFMYYVSLGKSCSVYKVWLGIPSVTRAVWITRQANEIKKNIYIHDITYTVYVHRNVYIWD